MRASLGLTIAVMGLLGMMFALVTGEIYRRLALDNQREAMVELVALKSYDLLQDLEQKSRELGLDLQADATLRRATEARDAVALEQLLERPFHQYFVTAGVIDLKQVLALDTELELIARNRLLDPPAICPGVIADARRRTGAARLRSLSGLCQVAGRPHFTVIVPIGGLRLQGYLAVVSDPVFSLRAIERALGMPSRLALPDGRLLHRSPGWPPPHSMQATIVADHVLHAEDRNPLLDIAVVRDVKLLHEKLARTRHYVMLAAGLATAVAVFVALLVLEYTALSPLQALRQKLLLMRQDRTRLGEQLPTRGNIEINALSQDFNALSKELKDTYETLERMAFTDELTALPNRARFRTYLQAGAQPLRPDNPPFALFVMDLDRFKEVNDTLGHEVGDELLRQVGERLKGSLRGSDIVARLDDETRAAIDGDVVARLGGDEFAAILPTVRNTEGAASVAEKLIHALDAPFTIDGNTFTIGMSIGIALHPEHGTDQTTLLRQADAAMYEAKRSRNGYAFASVESEQTIRAQFEMEHELRRAIDENELELHYQPKIEMSARTVRCAEALVRWRRTDGTLLPPDEFIPLAEKTGLIKPLAFWVLDRALNDCAAWHRAGFALDVAVNLSALNLHDPHLADQIASLLEKWQVRPERLLLELTESAVMSDSRRALQVLSRLDTMGVKLSIDDFGTGYSSLAYLRNLPVDEIKIDKSFVIDMSYDSNDAAIVRSTIDLAHNMGLNVVGEGVESEEVLTLLASLSCDLAQGFHVSQPLPLAQLLLWLSVSAPIPAASL